MLCKHCKYYKDNTCNLIEWDDPDYPKSNGTGFGLVAGAHDDSGMYVQLRVDPDFGCIKFVKRPRTALLRRAKWSL